ncbi:hypothetical protein [Pseudomonas putida]|uniref:hypothetical protein n=1 Tax=Pseudomonas putida TaxID=303 RepID=UPI002117E123|nr:hypothetical protein [Pseudomonas putida]
MSKDTGGPAFPTQINNSGITPIKGFNGEEIKPQTFSAYPGMNLRDYLAAKAMNGYLANAWQAKELDDTGDSSGEQMRIVAEISYAMADAMLAARVKP